jgi:hypothetical protein
MAGLHVLVRDRVLFVTTRENAEAMEKELRERVTPVNFEPPPIKAGGGADSPPPAPPAGGQPPAPQTAKTAPPDLAKLQAEMARLQAEVARLRQAKGEPKQDK